MEPISVRLKGVNEKGNLYNFQQHRNVSETGRQKIQRNTDNVGKGHERKMEDLSSFRRLRRRLEELLYPTRLRTGNMFRSTLERTMTLQKLKYIFGLEQKPQRAPSLSTRGMSMAKGICYNNVLQLHKNAQNAAGVWQNTMSYQVAHCILRCIE